MANVEVLSVEDLRVSYSTPRGRLMAVDGISFQLKPGETFGLVGESGSGKTTTANAILRLLGPMGHIEGGRVLLDGLDLLRLSEEELRRVRWRRVALIPQGAMNSLNPVMKVQEQIRDVILAHEGRGADQNLRERILRLLNSVGLTDRAYSMYPHELSGGMKQRVCIAMAIALNPQLILADEPTSALDVVVQRIVAETLKDVQQRINATVILIGHDMGIQAQLVDRLGIMYQGRLVEVGPVRSVFKDPRHVYTRRLIASIPSINHQRTLAERVRADASDITAQENVLDAALESILPLQEVTPGHFAAI